MAYNYSNKYNTVILGKANEIISNFRVEKRKD